MLTWKAFHTFSEEAQTDLVFDMCIDDVWFSTIPSGREVCIYGRLIYADPW